MTEPPRLVARGVAKRLGGRLVLRGVDIDATGEDFVAVLGPSGAGKTTLFRGIAGLIALDGGGVRLDGVDVARLRGWQRRRLAVVFQQFNLVGRLSALENVLAGRLGHVPAWRGWLRQFAPDDHARALDCLERVGLGGRAGQRADTLSGGQQQRVALARALAQQPRLIVADEPVASLDPATGAAILELLRGVGRAEGIAVVCSLHQVDLARRYADRIVGLAHGRVAVECPADRFDAAAYARTYGEAEAGAEVTIGA